MVLLPSVVLLVVSCPGRPPPLRPGLFFGGFMRSMKRVPVKKSKSARKFRAQTRRTNARNMSGPMRGGIRL